MRLEYSYLHTTNLVETKSPLFFNLFLAIKTKPEAIKLIITMMRNLKKIGKSFDSGILRRQSKKLAITSLDR